MRISAGVYIAGFAGYSLERRISGGEFASRSGPCGGGEYHRAQKPGDGIYSRRKNSLLLDAATSRGIFYSWAYIDRSGGNAWENYDDCNACLDFSRIRTAAGFSRRWCPAQFQRKKLWPWRWRGIYHRRR